MFVILILTVLIGCIQSEATKSKCKPLDIVFLIDSSGSETIDSFIKQKKFMKRVVSEASSYSTGTRFGAVSFSNDARGDFNLDSYSTKTQIHDALKNISQIGKFTHLEEGLQFVGNFTFTKANGDRPDAQNVLLILTDGIFHPENASEDAELLISAGVDIYVILPVATISNKLRNNVQRITSLKKSFTTENFRTEELFSNCSAHMTTLELNSKSSTTQISSHTMCKDNVPTCHNYGRKICTQYENWARIQCSCFCHFHQNLTTKSTYSPTQPSVHMAVPCSKCEDYFTFQCQSFLSACSDVCMIRNANGKLATGCTTNVWCEQQKAKNTDQDNTTCCNDNDCVNQALTASVQEHIQTSSTLTTNTNRIPSTSSHHLLFSLLTTANQTLASSRTPITTTASTSLTLVTITNEPLSNK